MRKSSSSKQPKGRVCGVANLRFHFELARALCASEPLAAALGVLLRHPALSLARLVTVEHQTASLSSRPM